MTTRLLPALCAFVLPLTTLFAAPEVTTYAIDAITSVRHEPDRIHETARASSALHLVATPGEYQPVSFLVEAPKGVEKLEIKAGALKGPVGAVISADAIDLRIVKSWYQGGTAWYSYFADRHRREFVPELLLHDDELIKVDREKKQNYLRVGDNYRHVSYTKEEAVGYFNYLTEPVADAATLLPVTIPKGENRQFWLTLKVPEDAKAGIYEGRLALSAAGKAVAEIAVNLRVLPFKLPYPKTYYNLENDYLVTIYSTDILNASAQFKRDEAETLAHQKAIYENLVAHNARNIRAVSDTTNLRTSLDVALEGVRTELRIMKEAGASMKPIIGSGRVSYSGREDKEEVPLEHFKRRVDTYIDTVAEEVGHHDIYLSTWDEAGEQRIRSMRDLAEYTQSRGIKLWMTTHEGRHYNIAGYLIDYANHGGWPDREKARTWHAVGAKVASYAGPHTGPENPDIFRRWEGLARYKENYDGSYNYKYFDQLHTSLYERQKQNVWNDFVRDGFRSFCMVYPTKDGVIDTIAWEGFREGIDDVRYATLLKQEARDAMASDHRRAGLTARKALVWLELLDAKTADLNAARQEMIEWILKIRNDRNL